ncbi:MAG TPA: hypothetical protein VKA46_35060 [Gemmataceae bacterium]|nr:hypothetical protein [Gemmataceae bacterium]
MADTREGPLPFDRERLERLPQTFDVWQLGTRQLAARVRTGDQAVRPWMTGVFSSTHDLMLAFELTHEPPTATQGWQVLLKAMRQPEAGEPHRPTEVQLAQEQEWSSTLRPPLDALNVGCVTVEALDGLDALLDELSGQLASQGSPSLLEMPGVTPEAVGAFFDAAALFYRQAPWNRTGERPIRIDCRRFESSPWYAVVMGQAGMTRGLVLYDDLATLLRIQEGDLPEEESARQTAALAVVFGDKEDLPAEDVAQAESNGWPVAGPEAYPSVYRMELGLSMRPPLAWELDLLEGCLRAVPEFARKKTRRLAPLNLTVPTAGGELPLVLSWAA